MSDHDTLGGITRTGWSEVHAYSVPYTLLKLPKETDISADDFPLIEKHMGKPEPLQVFLMFCQVSNTPDELMDMRDLAQEILGGADTIVNIPRAEFIKSRFPRPADREAKQWAKECAEKIELLYTSVCHSLVVGGRKRFEADFEVNGVRKR